MTTRVFYDSDGLFIDGMEAQPPRSLVSMIVGNRVWVRNRADFTLLALDYGQYADKTGATFASPTLVKAYLDAEFAKGIVVPVAGTSTPLIDSGTGAVGNSAAFARADHVHPAPVMPAVPSAGTATPQPLGTATAGTAIAYSREDHVHALPSGRLTLVGTVTVGETTLVALSLGVKRYSVTMAGLAVGDRVIAFLTGAPGSSSLQDVYVSATNTINVGLLNPALGIGATIAVPIAIYKLT